MNLQFITSISKNYWNSTGKRCISTWDLPGEVVIYIDQQEGELEWLDEVPYKKKLLYVPPLNLDDYLSYKTKVRKFWGKSCAQIHAIRNRPLDTRIVWLDADVEQLQKVDEDLFTMNETFPLAMMKSHSKHADCYETGLVIFNDKYEKLTLFANQYERFWNNEEELFSLHRPYDAMVLGALAEKKGFENLVQKECENVNALENTKFKKIFKHHINKENKSKLNEKN
jgi:hypothetical protein